MAEQVCTDASHDSALGEACAVLTRRVTNIFPPTIEETSTVQPTRQSSFSVHASFNFLPISPSDACLFICVLVYPSTRCLSILSTPATYSSMRIFPSIHPTYPPVCYYCSSSPFLYQSLPYCADERSFANEIFLWRKKPILLLVV